MNNTRSPWSEESPDRVFSAAFSLDHAASFEMDAPKSSMLIWKFFGQANFHRDMLSYTSMFFSWQATTGRPNAGYGKIIRQYLLFCVFGINNKYT